MVELLSYSGNDLMVVNVARVSYGKHSDVFEERDIKLINYLVNHQHTSPFRHPQLQFRITCPIYVERQLFKHQVGLCLAGDTYVTFIKKSGSLYKITIKDLFDKWNSGRSHQNSSKDKLYQQARIKGMSLRVLNEDTHEFEIGHIKDVMYSGMKEVYRITCEDGNSIKCSKDHRIYTNEGWKSIANGLTTSDFIGLNGLKYAGTGNYQVYEDLKSKREMGLSVEQMADLYGCSYHTIRKWLKIHNLKFTCQECGKGGKLHCHHIVPVTTDISRAYDKGNLITVCESCHQNIHRSAENEIKFAEKVTGESFFPLIKQFGKNNKNRKGNKLKVHFSKIVSIEKLGIEETYDIEVDHKYHNFTGNGIVVHNSANSISGRYVDFSDSYYEIPTGGWRKQSKSSKQGSEGTLDTDEQKIASDIERQVIELCKDSYSKLIEMGVSKEQARSVLPLNLNTTFIWSGSLLAFIHMWKLRLKPDAQQETREVAQEMLNVIKNIEGNPFEHTLVAFDL
jgi:thymidylate synthase (FAD)